MRTPIETFNTVINAGISKATANSKKLLIMSFLAGLFIAFAALASTIVSAGLLANANTFGLGKLLQGFVFSGGLIFVVIGGAELFTGNSLMIAALLANKISLGQLLRNWGLVYLGNLIGALFLAYCVSVSGIFDLNGGQLGTSLAAIAATKTSLSFFPAVILGILCNILVCLAVWCAFGAKTTASKVLVIIFPVMFFVICGFEHSVANMFYIPAGFFAAGSFSIRLLISNLIPVTIGNIIGGGLFIAAAYSFSLNNVKISLCETNPNPQQKLQKTHQKSQ